MNYDYDPDGFLTSKTNGSNVTNYTYSSRGELLSVSLPDGRFIEYAHDPLGRRIAKTVDGIIVEKYLWQGLTRLLAVYDGADNLLMRFEYADGRMPVAVNVEGVTYYLTYDQVGSLRLVADSAGNVIKSVEYDSFGNLLNDSNPAFAVSFGFAGGLHDRDTGFVRFGYRDYDPDIGRWTAKDPIFFEGGDTDLYEYVLNDPINLIDPMGLEGYWPTDNQTIISPWGARGGGFHSGTDIRNRLGSPVYATNDGTVIELKKGKKGGNQIKILNDDGSVSGYAHTKWEVSWGDEVSAGDVIGYSDGSGSGPPHLHFTYRRCISCPKEDPMNKLYDATTCH